MFRKQNYRFKGIDFKLQMENQHYLNFICTTKKGINFTNAKNVKLQMKKFLSENI